VKTQAKTLERILEKNILFILSDIFHI